MSKLYDNIIKKKEKDWNCPDLMNGLEAERGQKLPFSSPLMNWATYGGIPRDRITEFCGEPGSGKSSTAIDICKNAAKLFQKEYEIETSLLRSQIANGNKQADIDLDELETRGVRKVLYIDIEHGFDSAWAHTLGISKEDIDVMQPPDLAAEDLLQTLQEVVETGEVGLIVLDSIPTLVPRAELEKKYGERTVASLAGLLTVFCRKIVPLLTRYHCTLIFINQIRDNLENPYVIKTPGGQAAKFYASLRILFKHGHPVDFLGNEIPVSSDNPAGYIINAKLLKQKTAPYDRKTCSYYLMSSTGISIDIDYVQLAITRYDIIKKNGGWYTMCDPYTGEVLEVDGKIVKQNGLPNVYKYLQSNTVYFDKVKQYIQEDLC